MVASGKFQHFESRIRAGFAASWIASIAAAFVAGCFYSFFMEHGRAIEYSKSIALGDRNAWTVLLVVGGVAAAFASIISAFTLAFIWWPLCRVLQRREITSLAAYVSLGVLISILLVVVTSIIQHFFKSLMPNDYYFESAAILFDGFVASLVFWLVTRPGLRK